MDYTFRVDSLIPKAEFMSVTYIADGYPDYRRNFNPTDFSAEALTKIVTDFAPNVVHFWERQKEHPESASFTGGSGSAEAPVYKEIDPSHVPVIEPEPEYDRFTQYLTMNSIEDPMQETVGWTVTDMTADEQAQYLANWRNSFAVSMAQFRQALYKRGIIEAAMSMSAKDINSQILWETSDFVPRASERVKGAMGMTEEELDEFFIHASTLEMTL